MIDGPRTGPSAGTRVLNMMAVPLGVVGLAGVTQTLAQSQNASPWPAHVLYAGAAALWATMVGRYVVTAGRDHSFSAGRRDELFGPFAAYIPVVGILLAAHYEDPLGRPASWGVLLFVAALTFLVAQLLAHWLRGNFVLAAFHPGYFLPTVAGPFIASIGLVSSGWPQAAASAFGVGVFLWVAVGGLLFSRLFTGPPLPDVLKPTLAILVSAPATAGLAWMALSGGRPSTLGYGILGVLGLMAVVQVLLLGEYRSLGFMPSYWAFTFPVSAAANLVIRWLHVLDAAHADAWSWILGGLASSFVAAVAAATLRDLLRAAPPGPYAELDLRQEHTP